MELVTASNILSLFERHGLPGYGLPLDFLPSDKLINQLTLRFNVEFAVMFKIANRGYSLFIGNSNSVQIPFGDDEILLKHSHPRGTPHPSRADHDWLEAVQLMGSPQIQSVILPTQNARITFNINTPFIG